MNRSNRGKEALVMSSSLRPVLCNVGSRGKFIRGEAGNENAVGKVAAKAPQPGSSEVLNSVCLD